MAKASKEISPDARFGVLQQKSGSYTIDGQRFSPFEVTTTTAEIEDKCDPESVPIKFFAAPEQAAEEVARLRAKFSTR